MLLSIVEEIKAHIIIETGSITSKFSNVYSEFTIKMKNTCIIIEYKSIYIIKNNLKQWLKCKILPEIFSLKSNVTFQYTSIVFQGCHCVVMTVVNIEFKSILSKHLICIISQINVVTDTL